MAKTRGVTSDLERLEFFIRMARQEVEGQEVITGAGLAPATVISEYERWAAEVVEFEPGDEAAERRFLFAREARDFVLDLAERVGYRAYRGVTPRGVEFMGFREIVTGRFARVQTVFDLMRAALTGFGL